MLNLNFSTSLSEEEKQVLLDGLATYAVEKTSFKKEDVYVPFQFCYKDQNGEVKAGIIGFCYYRCLYIDILWVHADYRKQELGAALIEQAELFGKENGCLFSTVNTMDWEAPEFYKKLGYKIEFIREGYKANHQMICFRKSLL